MMQSTDGDETVKYGFFSMKRYFFDDRFVGQFLFV